MRILIDPHRLSLIFRYYQAGVINTLVGFGLYVGFVRLGLNQYLAQMLSHVLGMAFNYMTYSRHVFRSAGPAKMRFVIAYAFSYLLSVACLAATSLVVPSPYLAGALAIVFVSLLNYFVLRHIVFVQRPA